MSLANSSELRMMDTGCNDDRARRCLAHRDRLLDIYGMRSPPHDVRIGRADCFLDRRFLHRTLMPLALVWSSRPIARIGCCEPPQPLMLARTVPKGRLSRFGLHFAGIGCCVSPQPTVLAISAQPNRNGRLLGDSSKRASLDQHHLLGGESVVDPISPMLHQLRALADQRERPVPFEQTLSSRVILPSWK